MKAEDIFSIIDPKDKIKKYSNYLLYRQLYIYKLEQLLENNNNSIESCQLCKQTYCSLFANDLNCEFATQAVDIKGNVKSLHSP
jgi:hypothetical protein